MSEGPLHLTFRDEGMSEHLGDHKELSLWVYPINYQRWIDFGNRAWWVTINLLGNMDCFIARLHVRSMEQLDTLLDRINVLADTNTAIIKKSPVKRRLPPMD